MIVLSLSVFWCIWWKSIVSCLSVVGETCSLTCFPLLGVYLTSKWVFLHCVSVWMDEASLHCHSMFFQICFFLQTLLSFSNFSLLQLGFIFSLALTFTFSFPSPSHFLFIGNFYHLSPCGVSRFPWTLKSACVSEIKAGAQEAACQGSTTHQRVPVANYVTNLSYFLLHICKMGMRI